jgi:NTP pyrophosphatase (non-canonical NTP hydrolase)
MGYPSFSDSGNAQEDLTWINNWIDSAPANAARDPEARTWGRVAKIGEEFGEVVAAMIAATGQNPRKPAPVRSDLDDLAKETLDVALTALALYEHLTTSGRAIVHLFDHIESVRQRAEAEPEGVGSDIALG